MARLTAALEIVTELLARFEGQSIGKLIRTMTASDLSPLGRTALFMAAGRAVESKKPESERAFNDPYAHRFAASLGNKYLQKMSKYAVSYIKFRTLYIDDHITNILAKHPDEAIDIVILGVGCDTRSHRMECIQQRSNVTVYELDLLDVIQYRDQILYSVRNGHHDHNPMTATIIPIAVDFRNNEWIDLLVSKGYNGKHCNIWLAEGLFPFLKQREIDNLFENIERANSLNSTKLSSKHWLIGNFLNSQTKLQGKFNSRKQWGQQVETIKTGHKRPHLLLEQFGYSQWNITPVGGFKKIKTYPQYLKSIGTTQDSSCASTITTNVKADHHAKSFMFIASKNMTS